MRKKNKWLISAAVVVLAALYPVIFTYAQNVAEVDFVEVLPLVLLYPAFGLVIWGILGAVTKAPYKSSLGALLFVFFLANYMMVQKVVQLFFGNLKYWHILPIGLFVLGHVIYFLFKIKEKSLEDVVSVGAIVMVALLLINLVPAVPTIIQKIASASEEASASVATEAGDQPNIYWFVFDECASFPVIKEHYGYTDTTYQDHLTEKGFFISHSSRNESGNTNAVLTNCLNLDYVVNSSMSLADIEPHTNDPAMYHLLEENNYSIRGVGDTLWLGGVESVTNSNASTGGQTVEGTGVLEMILQNSVAAPFVSYDGTSAAKVVLDAYAYLQDDANIYPNSSLFTMCYLCTPHQPFLFDADGNFVSAVNYNNWDAPQHYLGQYIFTMKNLCAMVDCILENDEDCVIIVQSDHGPRFKDGMTFAEQTNVLNAVYYRGEDISEIDGKSNVNTFRIVFNRLFGTQMEEVPVNYEG